MKVKQAVEVALRTNLKDGLAKAMLARPDEVFSFAEVRQEFKVGRCTVLEFSKMYPGYIWKTKRANWYGCPTALRALQEACNAVPGKGKVVL